MHLSKSADTINFSSFENVITFTRPLCPIKILIAFLYYFSQIIIFLSSLHDIITLKLCVAFTLLIMLICPNKFDIIFFLLYNFQILILKLEPTETINF